MKGAVEVIEYTKQFIEAFPDVKYEPEFKHESGNTAIDEGWIVGTNSGALPLPTGETLPPTGKRVRVRSADIATVENGRVTRTPVLLRPDGVPGELGILPETPS